MVKLNMSLDWRAQRIQSMLDEGRAADAKTALVEELRAGTTRDVQKIAADLLKPATESKGSGRGRPSARFLQHWIEIGEACAELRDRYSNVEHLEAEVSRRFGYSEAHVRKCRRAYEAARSTLVNE